MKSHYTFEKKENYLHLVLTGEYDKDDFMFYPKLISQTCAEENSKRIMVNALSLQGTDLSTMDRFDIAENLANTLGSKAKIAVVWPKEHITRFAETVAVNRGTLINVVGSIVDAELWLKSKI
jgi:hypothetical protein